MIQCKRKKTPIFFTNHFPCIKFLNYQAFPKHFAFNHPKNLLLIAEKTRTWLSFFTSQIPIWQNSLRLLACHLPLEFSLQMDFNLILIRSKINRLTSTFLGLASGIKSSSISACVVLLGWFCWTLLLVGWSPLSLLLVGWSPFSLLLVRWSFLLVGWYDSGARLCLSSL